VFFQAIKSKTEPIRKKQEPSVKYVDHEAYWDQECLGASYGNYGGDNRRKRNLDPWASVQGANQPAKRPALSQGVLVDGTLQPVDFENINSLHSRNFVETVVLLADFDALNACISDPRFQTDDWRQTLLAMAVRMGSGGSYIKIMSSPGLTLEDRTRYYNNMMRWWTVLPAWVYTSSFTLEEQAYFADLRAKQAAVKLEEDRARQSARLASLVWRPSMHGPCMSEESFAQSNWEIGIAKEDVYVPSNPKNATSPESRNFVNLVVQYKRLDVLKKCMSNPKFQTDHWKQALLVATVRLDSKDTFQEILSTWKLTPVDYFVCCQSVLESIEAPPVWLYETIKEFVPDMTHLEHFFNSSDGALSHK